MTNDEKNAFVRRLWHERKHTASKAMLIAYVESTDFKDACAEIIVRQASGETFSFNELADAIGIPAYLLSMWVETRLDEMSERVTAAPPRSLQ